MRHCPNYPLHRYTCTLVVALAVVAATSNAAAQSEPGVKPPNAALAQPKPPPYSLPWQLRPVLVGNVVRSDTTLAFYEPPGAQSGTTLASMLLASFKVTPELAPLVRVGAVHAALPSGRDATHLVNPVLGATYAPKLGDNYRLGLFLGIALPLGGGGGDPPSADHAAANAAGIAARSSMDNAMFAANYFTVFPGVGFAYTAYGLTAQAEVTLLQLTHARGPDSEDSSRTNLTMGLHVGYFVVPFLSLGAELRHQRWLSTPSMVKANASARDVSTVAFGPRFHLQISQGIWLRPGLALALPIDDPMSQSKYKVVQLDLPLAF